MPESAVVKPLKTLNNIKKTAKVVADKNGFCITRKS